MGWWKTLEAERADVEKSGADELILLGQTNESKSTEATGRLDSSRGTNAKRKTGKVEPVGKFNSKCYIIKWDIYQQKKTMLSTVKLKCIRYTVGNYWS